MAQGVPFAYFRVTVPWIDVAKRTIFEIKDDKCLGLAAQLAFYFLLSLFPAVLFLVALIGNLPVDNAFSELLSALSTVAPEEFVTILRGQLDQIARGGQGSLLTLGIIGAIWSSSAATVAIIDALNQAYDVTESRPWWKRRIIAIALTLALALLVLAGLAFVLIGPSLAEQVAAWFGLAPAIALVWQIIRWPIIVSCAVLSVDLVYHFAPCRTSRWAWITPGAIVATVLWVAISFAFKFYIANLTDYTATYGTIGGVIVTMLWFYVSGLAILVGAELNSVVEETWRAAPADLTWLAKS